MIMRVQDVVDGPCSRALAPRRPVGSGRAGENGSVSFDIYVQAFHNGDAADRPGEPIRRLLLEHADTHDESHSFVQVSYEGAAADVYGLPEQGAALTGLMFNHVGVAAFDLLVTVAQEADSVVLPVGCPVCVTSESQIPHLPEQLREGGVHVVRNGRDLLAVIRGS